MNSEFFRISGLLNILHEIKLDGLSDNLTVNDIAEKHKVPVEDILKQLAMGIKVEKEHTSDPDIQAKIARDHLTEDPEYYTKLAKMENA